MQGSLHPLDRFAGAESVYVAGSYSARLRIIDDGMG
jgi:hypothetical protein